MLELFHRLRRTDKTAHTAPHRIALFAHRIRSAFGTSRGKDIGRGSLRPLAQVYIGHFWDHISRAVNLHPVAHANILAAANDLALAVTPGDVILIMQRGIADHHAAHRDRRQPCDGAQRAGAPNLNVDRLQPCPGQFGGKLMRNRPTRRGRAKAKTRLQAQIIDLVDHAVDVIAQGRARLFDPRVMLKQRLHPITEHCQRVGLKPERLQTRNRAHLRLGQGRAYLAPAIGKEPQRPRRCDLGIQLPQRSRRGIARIGKLFVRFLGLPRVQRGEIGMAHIDFAAHFQNFGRTGQTLGNIGDGAGVGGDILTHLAIAARRGLHQPALNISQAQA